ncbi:MAG: GNAT family N-acetyltransferase [Chloroflexi bacterium]|nr:GNAT family N-acetyltransferase [Chloroflexota bacterium]
MDSIGVLSDYQRQGVARMLVEEIISEMGKVGVRKIYTLVNWRDGDMLGFFDKLGFVPGDMINLERKT